jgi:anti-anti-sigma factor
MDQFSFTAHKRFDILRLRGDIKVQILPALSPALSEHIAAHPQQHLVLDLADLTAVDASVTKLLVNIRKKLEAHDRKLYLLHAPEKFAAQLKGSGLTDAIGDIHELERGLYEDLFRTLAPYTVDEHDLKRLQCGCVVCGTRNVAGYLLDHNAYSWSWRDDDFFPTCTDAAGESFDYFAALPVVCLDCYMVSTDLHHFNIIDADGEIAHHSTLSENAKMHLTKNIKKRKKIVDGFEDAAKEQFFLYPRVRSACYAVYLLADSCARTLALNKNDADPFLVGFLNYLAIRYAEVERKEELIDNARTWLTQALAEKKIRAHFERAQAYFVLFGAALSLEKVKEANLIHQDFSAMMETISYSKTARSNINSPLFWFDQMQCLWRKEIEKKSTTLAKAP